MTEPEMSRHDYWAKTARSVAIVAIAALVLWAIASCTVEVKVTPTTTVPDR